MELGARLSSWNEAHEVQGVLKPKEMSLRSMAGGAGFPL